MEKAANLISQGVHLLVVDVFPPGKRDPHGIHKAIWEQFVEEDFDVPRDEPLTMPAYDGGPPPVAYVEVVRLGANLPDMPIFLAPDHYVLAPLDQTYRTTWTEFFPDPMKKLLGASGNSESGTRFRRLI